MNRDCVIVVRGQGPKANGMPELHKLMPILGSLQDQGYRVALVTDGRMSGASGKVPAAIHVSPEALDGGVIGLIQSGDPIRIDPHQEALTLLVSAEDLARRPQFVQVDARAHTGLGREMFYGLRQMFTYSEEGARSIKVVDELY